MEKLERHIYIAAPAEKVWDAIVIPSIASRYFIVPMIAAEPREGGKILYDLGNGNQLSYDVLECEPGRRLVHTFHLPSLADEPRTRVIYEVEPIGGMTKLTMIHDGFPSRNKTFEEVNGGWDFILSSLKSLLETGTPLPRPKAETVHGGDGSAPGARELRKEAVVAAPVAEVWRAWTTEEGLTSFLAERVRVDLRPGGAFEILFNAADPPGQQGSEGCVVIDFEPEKRLSFTWNAPPEYPNVRKLRTRVDLHFERVGDSATKVTLVETGWGTGEEWDEVYAYFQNAWGYVMRLLIERFAARP